MSINPELHPIRLAKSYERITGKKLIHYIHDDDLGELLYNAPFALVSHGVQIDPIFNYANKTAQTLWEMGWEEFTSMPSRFSAEPLRREERQLLLDQVALHGFSDDYEGIRISKSGKRFRILGATVWNVLDEGGLRIGQAAVIRQWEFL